MADPREVMARGWFNSESGEPDDTEWLMHSDEVRAGYIKHAQAALSALDAAGFAVVPKADLQAWLDRPAHGWVAARERIAAQVKQP